MKLNTLIYRIIIAIVVFLLIFPLSVILIWSVTKSWAWPSIVPTSIGLRGYTYLLKNIVPTTKMLLGSIGISSAVMLITLLICLPAAKAIGTYDFKGKNLIKLLLLAPIIVPPVAVAMGIHVTFIKLGLANTVLGVILVHLVSGIPYGVRILGNYYELMGTRMEDQAKILGASKLQVFFHVTLPMLSPALISAGSLIFIISFSQYFMTFLIGGGRVVTLSMVMIPYIQSGDRMMASVYSIIFIVTTLILMISVEKIVKSFYKNENFFYL